MRGLLDAAVRMGACGGAFALAALVVAGMANGVGPLAGINSSAHWIAGIEAARDGRFRAGVTLPGLATHFAASVFWAVVLLGVVRALAPVRWLTLLALGLGVGVVALVVDYGILPRDLSPGWHLVLPWSGVIAGFFALGLGLGAGGCWAGLPDPAGATRQAKGPA